MRRLLLGGQGAREAAAAGYLQLAACINEMIEARRAAPADDLLSELLTLDEAGDRLDRQELVTLVVTLLFAGNDTTRNQLGIGLYLFGRHPEYWAAIRKDPEPDLPGRRRSPPLPGRSHHRAPDHDR